jgi:hypothetical protein
MAERHTRKTDPSHQLPTSNQVKGHYGDYRIGEMYKKGEKQQAGSSSSRRSIYTTITYRLLNRGRCDLPPARAVLLVRHRRRLALQPADLRVRANAVLREAHAHE